MGDSGVFQLVYASWVLFGVVFVALAVYTYRRARERRERLMQECVARDWRYVGDDQSLVHHWSGEPFGRGDNRRATNVVTGKASGRDFVAFDYSFQVTTGSGKDRSTTTYRYAVCAIRLPAALPMVQVAPEGALARFADAVGLRQDIDFESEDFNRAFKVRAEIPKLASDILTPRTMELLLASERAAWRIEADEMVRWVRGNVDADRIEKAVVVLDRVVAGIPAFVWEDYRSRPGEAATP